MTWMTRSASVTVRLSRFGLSPFRQPSKLPSASAETCQMAQPRNPCGPFAMSVAPDSLVLEA